MSGDRATNRCIARIRSPQPFGSRLGRSRRVTSGRTVGACCRRGRFPAAWARKSTNKACQVESAESSRAKSGSIGPYPSMLAGSDVNPRSVARSHTMCNNGFRREDAVDRAAGDTASHVSLPHWQVSPCSPCRRATSASALRVETFRGSWLQTLPAASLIRQALRRPRSH